MNSSCRILVAMVCLVSLPPTVSEAQLFSRSVGYFYGSMPSPVVIGDIDGDNNSDIVVATYSESSSSGGLQILRSNGDGTFQGYGSYSLNGRASSLALGDLSSDGILDCLVHSADYGGEEPIGVLLGNGDGTFQDEVLLDVSSLTGPLALGDLDNDGVLDLVSRNRNEYQTISALLGNGDGTFQAEILNFTGLIQPLFAIGDIDSDGNLDLVLTGYLKVTVLLGNGDGSFENIGIIALLSNKATALDISDFNGDEDLDVAMACNGDVVSVLLGNGDGTFGAAVNYNCIGDQRSIEIGDLNSDTYPDLALAGVNTDYDHSVSVMLGNGDGTFQDVLHFDEPRYPYYMDIGYLDGDEHLDLVVSPTDTSEMPYGPDSISILFNRTDPSIAAEITCTPGSGVIPFSPKMTVALTNLFTGQYRKMAAVINVTLGGGRHITNWRSGYANIAPGSRYVTNWYQSFPDHRFRGDNIFELVADDITPAPYNQPPYPPTGDFDTASCTVTGIAP